ncbi:MAG: alpha/beta hydrolase [Syntrophorhabdaceae bacterium]|nr:alpha/beta hydrolase [Syntrophorhabdaceae bacterium]
MKKLFLLSLIVILILFIVVPSYGAGKMKIATETFFIESSEPGIKLHIRNKYPAGKKVFPPEKIVLFVHGATYPSESTFDINLPGGSWMDYTARMGYDTYIVDIRGYGRSTRPPSMDAPPEQNQPFATTAEAIKDVGSAVDFILKRRKVEKINLVGWSWGTTLMGGYTAQNNGKVVKLVLYAPLWTLKEPPPFTGSGAYRMTTKETARARALRGIPETKKEEIHPQAWFDKWWEANLATDTVGATRTPPVIRSPNGVLKDIADFLGKGIPLYNPSEIKVPTFLIVAEWDQDTPLFMAQEVFSRLTNTPYKRMVVLGEGTHMIAVEKNRMELIREVQRFLDERR